MRKTLSQNFLRVNKMYALDNRCGQTCAMVIKAMNGELDNAVVVWGEADGFGHYWIELENGDIYDPHYQIAFEEDMMPQEYVPEHRHNARKFVDSFDWSGRSWKRYGTYYTGKSERMFDEFDMNEEAVIASRI